MKDLIKKFWVWYEDHYKINLGISTFLFALQLIHLYWLTAHVVFQRLFAISLWDPNQFLELVLIFVDYTEIPAIFAISLVFINELRKHFTWKNTAYLVFINSQWLHIFWITDELVIQSLITQSLPAFIVWVAILIDYLEIPVIFATIRKFILATK